MLAVSGPVAVFAVLVDGVSRLRGFESPPATADPPERTTPLFRLNSLHEQARMSGRRTSIRLFPCSYVDLHAAFEQEIRIGDVDNELVKRLLSA